MKRMIACLLLLLLALTSLDSSFAEAKNWVWVSSNDFATYSIDSDSVSKYRGTIYYWNKRQYIESPERTAYIEQLKQYRRMEGDDDTDFSDLWAVSKYMHAYLSMDGTVYFKILDIFYLDHGGNVISTRVYPEDDAVLMKAPKNSVGYEEYNVARHYAK